MRRIAGETLASSTTTFPRSTPSTEISKKTLGRAASVFEGVRLELRLGIRVIVRVKASLVIYLK